MRWGGREGHDVGVGSIAVQFDNCFQVSTPKFKVEFMTINCIS